MESNNGTFFEKHRERLNEFTYMSVTAGERSDYVQGGGGNTSCKLDDRLMAIKASGFCLNQITPNSAYAVLDYKSIRQFYKDPNRPEPEDMEKIGSEKTKEAVKTIEGLESLRPSVEAGFHSMLDTFVLHSHSVYANLVTCAEEGEQIAKEIMEGISMPFVYVPYINPGAQLTFAIQDKREEAAKQYGMLPQVIFMENHGLIITAEEEKECLSLHDQINSVICDFFQISFMDAWPNPSVKEEKAGEKTWLVSWTPALKKWLRDCAWNSTFFASKPLYPDQLVFLGGQITIREKGSMTSFIEAGEKPETEAVIFKETSEILYSGSKNSAQTIEETLCALFFITETIKNEGYTVKTMSETGKDFIQNWESEKYRKNLGK